MAPALDDEDVCAWGSDDEEAEVLFHEYQRVSDERDTNKVVGSSFRGTARDGVQKMSKQVRPWSPRQKVSSGCTRHHVVLSSVGTVHHFLRAEK
eukprot:8192990-Pyramimonas_sp.AAC.4